MLVAAAPAFAQQEREFMREGNRLYKEKKYDSASTSYLAAAAGKPDYASAWFNLGNSEAQQGKHDKAIAAYNSAIANTQDKQLKASSYYGLGNTFSAQKKWQEAVQAYRQSLRQSPGDADTKYNYSYALSKLKEQQEQQRQQQQNQQNKQQKPPPPPQTENDPQQKKKKQENNGGGPQGGQNKGQKNGQPQKSKISREQADNILNALQQDEQRLQRDKNKGQPVPVGGSGKDW